MTRYPALFLFAGLGGGALGFARASTSVRRTSGSFRVAGAVDIDPAAAVDFERFTGFPCTIADIGAMTPAELRGACSEPPAIVFTSPPCKGFSGCLPAAKSATPHYQDLNSLAVRGIWLALEAWPESPPRLCLVENVPRIQQRGRPLLDQIEGLLRAYGYTCRESIHDCGELGGLGQRRRRFLLVARHMRSVPNLWFEPAKQRLRSVGDVIGELPIPWPGSEAGGPMHRLPRLSALNWLRLALVPAGGDWRQLPGSVAVVARDGRQNGGFGVESWEEPGHSVLAEGSVANTRAAVVDPRPTCAVREGAYGVTAWGRPSTTVIAHSAVHNGPWQVTAPRIVDHPGRHAGCYGVTPWDGPANTITGKARVDRCWVSTGDPRIPQCAVLWVCSNGHLHGDADVLERFDLADRRPLAVPPIIIAADGTWHRPMTTLELAALQSLPTQLDGGWAVYGGRSHKAWRERIGNAVPPDAAQAIAESALRALLAAELGVWELGAERVWVERATTAEGVQ